MGGEAGEEAEGDERKGSLDCSENEFRCSNSGEGTQSQTTLIFPISKPNIFFLNSKVSASRRRGFATA